MPAKSREVFDYRITKWYFESPDGKEDNYKMICKDNLEAIFKSSDAIEQIVLMKQIPCHLSGIKEPPLADFHFLGLLFYESPYKFSQNGTLQSILIQLYEDYKEELTTSLEYSFEVFLNYLLRHMDIRTISSFADCFMGLANFPIKRNIIDKKCRELWVSFVGILTYLSNNGKNNPVELYASFNSVLQAFMNFFIHSTELKRILQCTDNIIFNAVSPIIVNVVQNLLINDGTLLDCRIRAGIALCYYLYASEDQAFLKNVLNENENSFFKLSQYSFSSKLCVYNGILAVVSVPEFLSEFEGSLFGIIMFNKILAITNCANDSELLLFNIRILHQWTRIAGNILTCSEKIIENSKGLEIFKKTFRDYGMMKLFYDIVLLFGEHSLDALKHVSYDLFLEALKLHSLSLIVDVQYSLPLRDLCKMIMNLPNHSEGKYGLLARIVGFIGPEALLHWFPNLPEVSFYAMQEPSLVSSVCELITTFLLESYKRNLDADVANNWFDLLVNYLCSDCEELSFALNEKLLPKLFKTVPGSVDIILDKLKKRWIINPKHHSISTAITCMKFQKNNSMDSQLDCLPHSTLEFALIHVNDQVRLSFLSFLCENGKTTAPIPSKVFNLIKNTLPYNINCQAPAFRQRLISSMKKLFLRIDKSMYLIDKKEKTNDPHPEAIHIKKRYMDFLHWLKEFLYNCLKPGANFPRRGTALSLLHNMHLMFPKFPVVDTPVEAETLLYTLQDTYENNKILSIDILSQRGLNLLPLIANDYYANTLQTALILASSTKPPDTVTAGYLFLLMVKDEHFNSVFTEHIRKQDSPANQYCFTDTSFLALKLLVGELVNHYKLAEFSLLEAAAHTPMYGVLASIRMVLSQIDFRSIEDKDLAEKGTSLIHEIIILCLKVVAKVEPVVCNSSPEGYLPVDTNNAENIQLPPSLQKIVRHHSVNASHLEESVESETSSITKGAVTAQVLLLCCWRTHKEISLLLGDMAHNIPIENNSDSKVVLSYDKVLDIGNYFILQMTTVKHKGAIEQAYVGFTKFCKTLWRCSIEKFRDLPQVWMNDLISAIKGEKEVFDMCATRRSAGLPFIVQAILASQTLLLSQFFNDTIDQLLHMAKYESDNSDTQVHALNILRALFRDACFSDALSSVICKALEVSISGFKSQSWAVRNSSTMLFSALHTRMFGVSHSDEAKKNKFSDKVFFSSYKGTYSVMYEELRHCASILTQEPNSVCKVPALYPALLILRRLHSDSGKSETSLRTFTPFVQAFACSPVMKIRTTAAKTLASIIPRREVLSTLQVLFDGLSPSKYPVSQNKAHGKCLQILYLLKQCPHLGDQLLESLHKKLERWIVSHFVFASETNPCYNTRVAYLEVVFQALNMGISISDEIEKQLFTNLLNEIEEASFSMSKEHYLCVLGVILLNHMLPDETPTKFSNFLFLVNTLLSSKFVPVQCMTLKFLISIFENPKSLFKLSSDSSVNPVFPDTLDRPSLLKHSDASQKHVIASCGEIAVMLLKIIVKEDSNSSCLGLAYHLLPFIPISLKLDVNLVAYTSDSDEADKLILVLNHIKECEREDVFNSMLVYCTHVAVELFTVLIECKKDDSADEFKFNRLASKLEEWSYLIERSSQPDNCISRRIATVHAFKSIPCSLLFNDFKIPSRCVYLLWQSLLCLLVDDEPDVKKATGTVVMSLQSSFVPVGEIYPSIPLCALETMIQIFSEKVPCDYPDCVAVLLNWMISNNFEIPDEMGDEQPFDKGEMNVFAEDLIITEFVSKYLTQYLRKHSMAIGKINTDLVVSLGSSNSNVKELDLESVYAQILMYCSPIVEYFETSEIISPLVDTYFDYNFLQLCQALHVLLCLKPWCSTFLDSKLRDIVKRIRELNFRTFYLNDLLSKLSYCVDN